MQVLGRQKLCKELHKKKEDNYFHADLNLEMLILKIQLIVKAFQRMQIFGVDTRSCGWWGSNLANLIYIGLLIQSYY